jgi:hypothetical protein
LGGSPFSLPLPSFPTRPLNELRHTHTHTELRRARIVLLITAHRHARNSDTHTHTRTHTLSLTLTHRWNEDRVHVGRPDGANRFVGQVRWPPAPVRAHVHVHTRTLHIYCACACPNECVSVCMFRVYGQSSKRIRNPQN